ncbi:MAG: DUF3467 domain-containing protein [Chloroflexi bacterium]|nr:DUF3467 domain-containing protein [Chloroflexota bacterium]
MSEENTESEGPLIVRINPKELRPEFVNDFLVSHIGHSFFLTFSLVDPPPPPMRIGEELSTPISEELDGIAISRIVVAPIVAKNILAALSSNIEKFEKKHGPIEMQE